MKDCAERGGDGGCGIAYLFGRLASPDVGVGHVRLGDVGSSPLWLIGETIRLEQRQGPDHGPQVAPSDEGGQVPGDGFPGLVVRGRQTRQRGHVGQEGIFGDSEAFQRNWYHGL